MAEKIEICFCKGRKHCGNRSKIEVCFCKGRKYCGNRRKCWLPVFSPFLTMFLKCVFVSVVNNHDCEVKGQTKLIFRISNHVMPCLIQRITEMC